MRFGFCRGRPFARGTLTSASVASASVTSPGEALSSRTPSGRPPPSTSTIHFVPLPRLVLPTAEPLFSPERNCRPESSPPTSAALRRPAPRVAPARRRAIRPAPPTASADASRWPATDTCRAEIATPLRSARSIKCLPGSHGWTPTDGPAYPCAASAPATAERPTPTARRSTTRIASCPCKKLNKTTASPKSTWLEAEPIYETRSRTYRDFGARVAVRRRTLTFRRYDKKGTGRLSFGISDFMRALAVVFIVALTVFTVFALGQAAPQPAVTVHQIFVEDQTDQPTHTPRNDPSPEVLKAFDDRAAARRATLHAMLSRGEITSDSDLYEAAFVFQHGETAPDYLLAHVLALDALAKGFDRAKWLSVATLDRYLQLIGQPQVFGTQYPFDPKLPHPI